MAGVVVGGIDGERGLVVFQGELHGLHGQIDGARTQVNAGDAGRIAHLLARHHRFERILKQGVRFAQVAELQALGSAAGGALGIVEPERFAPKLQHLPAADLDGYGWEQVMPDQVGILVALDYRGQDRVDHPRPGIAQHSSQPDKSQAVRVDDSGLRQGGNSQHARNDAQDFDEFGTQHDGKSPL